MSRELEALQEETAARHAPSRRRAGRRSQGHAPRRIQGRPGLPPRQLEAAWQNRAARRASQLAGQPTNRRSRSRMAAAGWSWRNGSRDRENPLTARVMVNRIWQHHFGEGLVRTPNDFGERGEPPSNPALLDWLAARFVESGWSVKAMHRLIMLSSAYQQSSRTDAEAIAKDPDNRLFGRMNRRRLDAESIRDSLLAVAGSPGLHDGRTIVRRSGCPAPQRVSSVRSHRPDRDAISGASSTGLIPARSSASAASRSSPRRPSFS